jgi:hypothetical protein
MLRLPRGMQPARRGTAQVAALAVGDQAGCRWSVCQGAKAEARGNTNTQMQWAQPTSRRGGALVLWSLGAGALGVSVYACACHRHAPTCSGPAGPPLGSKIAQLIKPGPGTHKKGAAAKEVFSGRCEVGTRL